VRFIAISEYGRRVEQNGSNGTDHGAVAPMMLFGGGLNGNECIGAHSSQTNLDVNGNTIYNTDYIYIYIFHGDERMVVHSAVYS
jgi:uncharacterized protein (DUF1501 family)